MKEIDELYEDEPISGQEFSVVSIVGPSAPQKCGKWAVKIRGVSNNLDNATKLAKRIYEQDSSVHIHVVETGKFFPVGFDYKEIKGEVIYGEKELHDIVRGEADNKASKEREWKQELEKRKAATERDALEGVETDALTDFISVETVTKDVESIRARLAEAEARLVEYKAKLAAHPESEVEEAREKFSKMSFPV